MSNAALSLSCNMTIAGRLCVDDAERRCLLDELRLSLRHSHLFMIKGIMDGRETWSRRRLVPASTCIITILAGQRRCEVASRQTNEPFKLITRCISRLSGNPRARLVTKKGAR